MRCDRFSLTIFLVLILVSSHFGVTMAEVPVEYGGNEELDACQTLGHVDNLNSGPKGFLAVKDAPDLKAGRIDKLYNKQVVWICSESKDGKWYGIVYTKDAKQDCGTNKSMEARKPYDGPCKSGWVAPKWVVQDAG